jgi:hypothetical protein
MLLSCFLHITRVKVQTNQLDWHPAYNAWMLREFSPADLCPESYKQVSWIGILIQRTTRILSCRSKLCPTRYRVYGQVSWIGIQHTRQGCFKRSLLQLYNVVMDTESEWLGQIPLDATGRNCVPLPAN